jgi:hypothetical protein
MSSLHEHEDHTAAELRSDTLSQALVRAAALTPTAGLRFLDRRWWRTRSGSAAP